MTPQINQSLIANRADWTELATTIAFEHPNNIVLKGDEEECIRVHHSGKGVEVTFRGYTDSSIGTVPLYAKVTLFKTTARALHCGLANASYISSKRFLSFFKQWQTFLPQD